MPHTAVIWAFIGLVLLGIEMISLHFVLLFFGIAALLVAASKVAFNFNHLTWEIMAFTALGTLGAALMRGKWRQALQSRGRYAGDQLQEVKILEVIPPHREGRVLYQGTTWLAVNDSDEPIELEEKVAIVRTEGVKLYLRKVSSL